MQLSGNAGSSGGVEMRKEMQGDSGTCRCERGEDHVGRDLQVP